MYKTKYIEKWLGYDFEPVECRTGKDFTNFSRNLKAEIEAQLKGMGYRRLFKGNYSRKYDDFVCVNELGELIRPSYVTQHFSDLLKKYGLRHIRFHGLRHTFASLLISQNVPLINVSNFLGHSDLATTSNIYAHLDKASKQASADIMTDILSMGKE